MSDVKGRRGTRGANSDLTATRVLLVSDEPDSGRIWAFALQQMGLEVVLVSRPRMPSRSGPWGDLTCSSSMCTLLDWMGLTSAGRYGPRPSTRSCSSRRKVTRPTFWRPTRPAWTSASSSRSALRSFWPRCAPGCAAPGRSQRGRWTASGWRSAAGPDPARGGDCRWVGCQAQHPGIPPAVPADDSTRGRCCPPISSSTGCGAMPARVTTHCSRTWCIACAARSSPTQASPATSRRWLARATPFCPA